MIAHIFSLCWRVGRGASHPFAASFSARAIALFRFRAAGGPNWRISRTRIVGFGQRFTSQSRVFSIGVALGSVGGTIGFSNGPLGIVSGSAGRSFGLSIYRAKKLVSPPSCLASSFVAIGLSLQWDRVVLA